MLKNPFLGRQLSELIASRGAVNFEGESPFNAYMNRRKLGQIDQAINRIGQRPQQPMPQRPGAQRPMPQQPMAPAPAVTPMPTAAPQPMMPQMAASQFRPLSTQFRGFPQWGALGMGRTPMYGGMPIGQFRGFGTGPGMVNMAAKYPL